MNLAIVGLLLVVGAGIGFWYVVQSLDEREQYVVAARAIERWERLGVADLTAVEANVGDAVAMTPSQVGAIVGNWATGRVPQGTLITPGMFAPPPLSGPAEAGRVILQISLPAGEVAFGTLETGDTIALLGRESVPGDEFAEFAGESQVPLGLIGILRLDMVQGGNIYYIEEPAEALRIERMVNRYLTAADRKMWKIGIDVTAEQLVRALRGDGATVTTESTS